MNYSLKRTLVIVLEISLILIVSSSGFQIRAQVSSGNDVAFPGQNLQRTYFSNDTAPNSPNLLWKFKLNAPPGVFSCVVVNGVVYQGCLGTGDIYAVNETTGQQIWHRNLNNTEESISYYNGMIYTQGGSLPYNSELRTFGDLWIALDSSTGDTVWTYQVPQSQWILSNVGTFGYPPIIVDGKMYIEVYDGIATLNASTGQEMSRFTAVVPRSFFNAYNNGNVFTVSAETNPTDNSTEYYAVCCNMDSQTVVWRSHDNPIRPLGVSTVGQGFLSGVSVSGDVYINEYNYTSGNGPDRLYRINSEDGTIAWVFTIQGYPVNLAVAYNNVYAATTAGNVYCVNSEEGTLPVWEDQNYGSILAPIAVADQKVFVGSENGYVYALDAFNGSLVWDYRTSGAVEGSPVIADNKLFIASKDSVDPSGGGYLYAFGSPPPKPISTITLTNPQTIGYAQAASLTGRLTDASGNGVANAQITLQQRLIPRTDWTNIATVTTDSNGNYQATWTPPIEASYDLNATYFGDSLAPSSAVSIIQVSPSQPVNINALATYLVAIIVLEVIIVVGIAWVVFVYIRKK